MNKFLAFILLFVSGLVHAQQYQISNFSVQDGLGQSQVMAIEQDSLGLMWFGTQGGGLSRFDGKHFTNFTVKDGLKSNFVNHIEKIGPNNFLISTDRGISQLTNEGFLSAYDSLEAYTVYETNQDYISTSKGEFRKKNSSFTLFDFGKRYLNQRFSQVAFRGNEVWCASDRGLVKVEGNQYKSITGINRVYNNQFTSVICDARSWIWAGSLGGGVSIQKSPNERFINFSKSDGLKSYSVSCLFEDSKGNVWIGSNGQGVSRFDGEKFIQITRKNGLAGDIVFSIFEDKEGSVWFGTSKGISKFEAEKYILYGEDSFLKGGAFEVLEDEKGFWYAPFSGGLILKNEAGKTSYSRSNGFTSKQVKFLSKGKDGTIIIGTDGAGVWKYQNGVFTKTLLRKQWVRDVIELSSGESVCATLGEGLIVLNGGKVSKINDKNGLTNQRINKILQLDSSLYLLTDDGVELYQNDTVVKVEGLPNERFITGAKFNNTLFLGTIGSGVWTIANDEVRQLKSSMLESGNIYAIYSDSNFVWLGTEKGLQQVYLNEANEVQTVSSHGRNEGFLGLELIRNSIYKDKKGHYWFGTVDGMTKYSPSEMKSDDIPQLVLQNVELNYHPIFKEEPFLVSQTGLDSNLLYNENHLTFRFKGVSQDKPQQLVYRWKLNGLETTWNPESKQEFVTYSNLAPGNYQFEVQTKINNENWSEPVSFHFHIEKPYWETLFFKLVVVAFFVMVAIVVSALIIRNVRKKSKLKQEKLLFDLKMKSLEQQALRLQMNPHFLFNCLNSIKGAIVTEDRKGAKKSIDRFAKLMRGMLDNTKEGKVNLHQELNTIEQYMELEKLNVDFDYKIDIGANINTQNWLIPSMMIQPIVENAIVHGLAPLKTGGKLSIKLKLINEQFLSCTVTDNGIGLKASQAQKENSVYEYESKGMTIIQSRLNLIKQEFPETQFSLNELEGVNGTTAELILPITQA